MKYQVALFDLDGTLIDTLYDLAAAMNQTLEAYHFPAWPVERYRQMVGNGMVKLTERALGQHYTAELAAKVLPDFLQTYDRDCTKLSKPYEDMADVMADLQCAGMRLFVVTNKTEAQAQKIILHFFGENLFEGVYGNIPGRKTKPDPAFVLDILKKAAVPRDKAVFIGDSNVDIQTALNVGIDSVGAVWGFRGEQELREAGADKLACHPRDLLEILLENDK